MIETEARQDFTAQLKTETGPDESDETNHKIAEIESRIVFWSRAFLIFALVLAAAVTCVLTYLFVKNEEQDDFTAQFAGYAAELLAVSQQNAESTVAALHGLSVSIMALAKATNQEWPFVTMPDFEALSRYSQAYMTVVTPIVEQHQKEEWEAYVAESYSWISETIDYRYNEARVAAERLGLEPPTPPSSYTSVFSPMIFRYRLEDAKNETAPLEEGAEPDFSMLNFNVSHYERFAPMWQSAPLNVYQNPINFDLFGEPEFEQAYLEMNRTHLPAIAGISVFSSVESVIMFPIFDNLGYERKVVGMAIAFLHWIKYFENLLAENAVGVVVVIKDTCGQALTLEINGPEAVALGIGDLHDPKYDDLEESSDFAPFSFSGAEDDTSSGTGDNEDEEVDACRSDYSVHVYPSDDLKAVYTSNRATYYTIGVFGIFAFTSLVFLIYDISVKHRQEKVMTRAKQSDAIVSSLFPSSVRARLYGDQNQKSNPQRDQKGTVSSRKRLKSYLSDSIAEGTSQEDGAVKSKPIADLFPSATVFFSDISGFTAWSSAREPAHVFELLESVYGAFDRLAKQYGVFKVETIGDCYMAVVGLPEPREDHAYVMAQFAIDTMEEMAKVTRELEVSLGPDTADLAMRMGFHSGQVTAGVLRGEKSRFQLFGDTVNTASRMESTGERHRIQISQDTADLLCAHGAQSLITPRENLVSVKGKGEMQTYWLQTHAEARTASKMHSSFRGGFCEEPGDNDSLGDLSEEMEACNIEDKRKIARLVDWNTDVLARFLKQIVGERKRKNRRWMPKKEKLPAIEANLLQGGTVLEEFKEIITLPKSRPESLEDRVDVDMVELSPEVKKQLRGFVSQIASMYKNNPFHNFEHASHVTASVVKLLSRIIEDHSYGITADPLTQFAVVLSAIIHDLDHYGIPNAVLVKEGVPIATKYKEKSVAEQNSVDLAWQVFMNPAYSDLRACIYADESELKRFRQLVVNTVMATDIADKELGAMRRARWEKAFSETAPKSSEEEEMNRKATIVIEHLIQASDIAHTMQHWKIYMTWNERLFRELYCAYKSGRIDQDPSDGWYKGELGFFDFYIIPLAKKLKNCGGFGVSSDEYLNYATANRREWERKGEEVVRGYIERLKD